MEPSRDITIRRATIADAEPLAELGARTFRETFGADNSAENMALHLSEKFAPELQRRELTDASASMFVACAGEVIVGYALLRDGSHADCVTGRAPIEIERIYVDAPWHGSGAAAALMRACEDEARRRGAETMWLGVWERNPRAIRFYEKNGFRQVGTQPFMLGRDPQTDLVMERPLQL